MRTDPTKPANAPVERLRAERAQPRASIKRASGALALAATLALTACQTRDEAEANRPGTDPVTVEQAYVFADSICAFTRPNFAGAQDRMIKEGFTVVRDGRHYSATKAVSAAVTTTADGRRLCSVRARYPGNAFSLEQSMTQLFGQPRGAAPVSPPAKLWNLNTKGNLLLFVRPGGARTITTYELGFVSGL